MFACLKKQLISWVENHQRREINRLRHESQRLTDEIEQATGEPFPLTPEELHLLAEKSKGIDPERLRQISTLHPEDLAKLIEVMKSLENQ